MAAAKANDYLVGGAINNSLCFLGPSRQFSKVTNKVMLMPGQGHFGPDARPGDARWRAGEGTHENAPNPCGVIARNSSSAHSNRNRGCTSRVHGELARDDWRRLRHRVPINIPICLPEARIGRWAPSITQIG